MPHELTVPDIIKLEPFEYTIVDELMAGYTQREIAAKYRIGTDDICRRVAIIRNKVRQWQKQNS
jgi:Trp operon repressor